MRLQVRSLTFLSELRIWNCQKLWCRSQNQLGSGVAAAVMQASSYSSNQTPTYEPPHAKGVALEKMKRQQKKTMWYWQRRRDISKWNRIENHKIDLPKYTKLILNKGAKAIQWKKDILFNKWCQTTRLLEAKKLTSTQTSNHIKKLTQNTWWM